MASPIRCAIYTRKSTEEGLDQEFNSLDAQREACAAYILSQRHEGWVAPAEFNDDGGFSGGNMQRPGLTQLMADVAAKKVDVIVVYKVDRLTRSLADFAKIVDVLDGAGASFVSVTQLFNTTTSMGRLTLNVLLSFAQFEREVTGERIRDKIAASKRKGLWMGGPVPLGYDVVDRKLVINDAEAATVRHIMQRYIHIGSIRDLANELATGGIRSKQRAMKDGSIVGGVRFSRGGLSHLLNNCVYIGQVRHKGEAFDGAQDAIVDLTTWQQVHTLLADQTPARKRAANIRHPSLLAGLLYDGHGRRMTPSHAVKQAKRYRYYMTQHVERGSPAAWRVPAFDLEQLVVGRLCRHLAEDAGDSDDQHVSEYDERQRASQASIAELTEGTDATRATAIASLISRIEVSRDNLKIHLRGEHVMVLDAAASLVRSGRQSRMVPTGVQTGSAARRDDALIKLVASAHAARVRIEHSQGRPLADVAQDHGYTPHYFSQLARLGGLAPDIVTAIIDGQQPAALTRTRLARTKALPLDWAEQRRLFGFA